ncbi:hypothetical protein T10_9789 [Trichinella papuae]|uniref:Uncharacterized protein n=1 Tax=Trichinella papuae TaxID=268474 RepID=A0A0V1N344_9BILA|nr:hypothetical protein T10_9789 [Trichinella papuae]
MKQQRMNQKSSESLHQLQVIAQFVSIFRKDLRSFHSVPHHTSKDNNDSLSTFFYWTIPTPLVAFDDQQAVSQLFIFEDTPPSGKRPEFRQFAKSNLPIPNRHRSFLLQQVQLFAVPYFFLLTL